VRAHELLRRTRLERRLRVGCEKSAQTLDAFGHRQLEQRFELGLQRFIATRARTLGGRLRCGGTRAFARRLLLRQRRARQETRERDQHANNRDRFFNLHNKLHFYFTSTSLLLLSVR
jgi:hypothetical protein